MSAVTVGFAMCGSFCTFEKAIEAMSALVGAGYGVLPIMSFNAANTDTRFGQAANFKSRVELICGSKVIDTIPAAEPIGPRAMCDVLAVAPCTGNTLAKLAAGITDTPVTMAVKSHLRGGRPVVVALSTNDALAASARNIGALLNTKNYYFVPFFQDDYRNKPTSLSSDYTLLIPTLEAALQGRQTQVMI